MRMSFEFTYSRLFGHRMHGSTAGARRVGLAPVLISALVFVALQMAGCTGTTAPLATGGGKLAVVAAENFWGNIAAQIGGTHVQVTSIITNPATDPHDYEPTSTDARTF